MLKSKIFTEGDILKQNADLVMAEHDSLPANNRRWAHKGDFWTGYDKHYTPFIIPTKTKNRLNVGIYKMYKDAGLFYVLKK
jgi:hypothetical protein